MMTTTGDSEGVMIAGKYVRTFFRRTADKSLRYADRLMTRRRAGAARNIA
jgi:hypothetical protein